ncbi:hypothetical protein AB0C18_24310 [Nonomuraea muscovyensis]|uniref:hypothetical protein n=1 Tax=Nonomuraea muscovyensis TaxID=1124761 RepID=UPI0033F78C8B
MLTEHPHQTVIADRRCHGSAFEREPTTGGVRLLRPAAVDCDGVAAAALLAALGDAELGVGASR